MTDPMTLAYFAGVFDSAGVLDLKDEHGHPKPCVELRCMNPALLHELVAAFGGRVTMSSARGPLWRYKRNGRPAQDIVRQIQPYLRRKRMEAQRVMAWKPMKPGIKVTTVHAWQIEGMELTKDGRGFGRRA